jgi:hypothetical protein
VTFTFDTPPPILMSDPDRVYLDTTTGPTENTLRSDGVGAWWYFTHGSAGDVTGDFDVSIDLYLPAGGGREIANFAFWMTDTESGPKGFMYRMQNAGGDSGFYCVSSGCRSGLVDGLVPDVTTATDTWYRLQLVAVGDTVTATVSVRDTAEILSTKSVLLPPGNRSGVFGQVADGAGRVVGQRWDNFTIR